jgi:GTP-binding protein Era
MTDVQPTACGFVAVLGAPNAGKSTLVNRLVGAKVSIVTHKVQTTRTRIRGVAISGRTQIVFVDTPGIFAPRRRLDRAMVAAAWEGAAEADAVLVLADAPRLGTKDGGGKAGEDTQRIVAGLRQAGIRAILVLNKIDAMPREALLALTERLFDREVFSDVFMISAEHGDGVDDLLAHLAARMPEGPWLYPEDQAADMTERLLAAEVTREKLFLRLHQELPYASTVETESWSVLRDGSIRIEQVIFVERDSQKAIVLGKGGRTIKEIGEAARKDMGEMFGVKVHLFLHVKVRENWGDDPERYRGMGLEFPKK